MLNETVIYFFIIFAVCLIAITVLIRYDLIEGVNNPSPRYEKQRAWVRKYLPYFWCVWLIIFSIGVSSCSTFNDVSLDKEDYRYSNNVVMPAGCKKFID